MKTLFLARHAKSSRTDIGCEDVDRGLNARGKRDLHLMSAYLKTHYTAPERLCSSPAKRTKKTARAYATSRSIKTSLLCRDEPLYLASPETIVRCIEQTPEDISSLMVVGHNPGMTELVNICGGDIENLPTCGVVVLLYSGEFRGNFDPRACTVDAYLFPKTLFASG